MPWVIASPPLPPKISVTKYLLLCYKLIEWVPEFYRELREFLEKLKKCIMIIVLFQRKRVVVLEMIQTPNITIR